MPRLPLALAAAASSLFHRLPGASGQTTSVATDSPTPSPTPPPTPSPTGSPTPSPLIQSLVGCPPLWTANGSYGPGTAVSHANGGGDGSGSDVRGVYQCKEAPYDAYCPQIGYEPGTTHSDGAWTYLGKCDSSQTYLAPTPSPTTSAPTLGVWDEVGCPEGYEEQYPPYPGGAVVERGGVVYRCAEEWPASARCGQAGWEPGTGTYWTEAWTALGRCQGTLSPTLSPSSSPTEGLPLWDEGGCPALYVAGTEYAANATVSDDKARVYRCKEWPYNLLCGMAGYAPGIDPDFPEAWTVLGSCVGTLSPTANPTSSPSGNPTAAPSYAAWEQGGCPEEFDDTLATTYATGEAVARDGVVYECGGESGRCNQAGYEPGTGQMWSEAWTALGSCAGTIAPTPQPSLATWDRIGCPEEYDASGAAGYVEGSAVTLDGVVYRCTASYSASFCNVIAPDHADGALAWEKLGSCTGTLSPTANPTSAPSAAPTSAPTWSPWDNLGCPKEFDATLATSYDAGDVVSYDGHVYACGAVSARCNQGGYEPGVGSAWEAAWTLLGSCSGTMVPTGSPTRPVLPAWEKGGCPDPYDDATTYGAGDTVSAYGMYVYKCKGWPDTGFCSLYEPEADVEWGYGWIKLGGCSGTLSPTVAPTTLAPTPEIVLDCSGCAAPAYDSSVTYYATNVTHSGASGTCRQYACMAYPYELWCSNPAYEPGGPLSAEAWEDEGPC